MLKYIYFILANFVAMSCICQDIYLSKNAEISFFSEARLENIEAISKEAQCIVNTTTKEVVVKVKIKTFHFTNGLMEEHFNENYLESDKFPEAIFKGTLSQKIDMLQDAEYQINVIGNLTLHGITKPTSVSGKIKVDHGVLLLSSDFIIAVSDYHIDIPNDKLSNISQNIKIKIISRNVSISKK